jgi:CubicO group peptidase (beta-lactamase class C family)
MKLSRRRLAHFLLLLSVCSLGNLVGLNAWSADEPAHYTGLKPDEFLKRWLVLGPIPVSNEDAPDEAAQKTAFARDWLATDGGESALRPQSGDNVTAGGTNLTWRLLNSAADTIDPAEDGAPPEFSIAYAWATIEMPATTRALLGIGSDDCVKVWLNGKPVHEQWIGRPVQPDDDLVPVEFSQGTNQLLIKVLNMQGPWGFACRLLGPESITRQFIQHARDGDLDTLKLLLDQGADLQARGPSGLTAAQSARLRGQKEVLEFLASRGANVQEPLPPAETLVDSLFTNLFKGDSPGAAVLVARDGKVLFEKGYGFADLAHDVPVTPETRFRIGSITKQFTAAAILKLQEEGRLSVHDKLSRFIPDYPRGDEVTVHHLLTHTSGIHSYTSKPGFIEFVTIGAEPEEHIKTFKNDPYDFDPGERWSYNNSGYFLLGYIIQKVTGKSYGDYLRETFFEPLGMRDSGVHEVTAIIEHEATGYTYDGGQFRKALNWDMSKAGGAGALYSTVRDLHRWNEAIFSHKVLSAATLATAFTPVRVKADNPSEPKETGYGYGWGIQNRRGLREIAHSGGLNGFVSHLSRIPAEDFSVAVLVNCAPNPPGTDPGELAQQIIEFHLHDKLKAREIPKEAGNIPAAALDAVTGRYDYGTATLIVTREGDALFAQLSGQPRHQIYPKSETEFFWKVAEAEISFIRDEAGKVTKAVHRQGGMTLHAPKLEDIPVIKLESEVLDLYVGRYDYGQGKHIMTISREGSRLFAQLTSQPRFEIFPSSETEFFWKAMPAKVTFVKGDAGKVTTAVHEQAGRKFDAPRMD